MQEASSGLQDPGEVTRLIAAYRDGEREAFDRLVPLVYDDLRRIARAHLRRTPANATLNTNGLVHEAWLRLADATRVAWESREHFLSVCARAMRQIVISNARKRAAIKRGGGEAAVTYDDERIGSSANAEFLLALDRSLERLGKRDEALARVVECRYFAGLTEPETAAALSMSVRTVQRNWMRARAWLREDLGGPLEPNP